MKKNVLAFAGLMAVTSAWAEEVQEAPAFSESSTFASVIESIPGTRVSIPWLPNASVVRYDDTRFDKDKTMPAVRQIFDQWCKAKSGKILQPRDNNCTLLKSAMGCANGELQYPGLETDFERGLKDVSVGTGATVEVLWPKASWLISENHLFNIFANKGPRQVAIVGGLQRCMADRNQLIGAMAFVSINGNNDLLFFDASGYETLAARGATLSKLAAERKREEAAQKKAQEVAKVAALRAGDTVTHIRSSLRGMIVEMKPPLAQVQWDKGFGEKNVEWHRLEELKPGRTQ